MASPAMESPFFVVVFFKVHTTVSLLMCSNVDRNTASFWKLYYLGMQEYITLKQRSVQLSAYTYSRNI